VRDADGTKVRVVSLPVREHRAGPRVCSICRRNAAAAEWMSDGNSRSDIKIMDQVRTETHDAQSTFPGVTFLKGRPQLQPHGAGFIHEPPPKSWRQRRPQRDHPQLIEAARKKQRSFYYTSIDPTCRCGADRQGLRGEVSRHAVRVERSARSACSSASVRNSQPNPRGRHRSNSSDAAHS